MAATRSKGDRIDALDKDLVGAYLDRIGRTPLLDAEEEVDLAKAIEGGLYAEQLLEEGPIPDGITREELQELVEAGLRAKQRFVEANLRLVVSIARKYPTDALPLIDLIQEGNLGLMRAVEKFDYRRGFKFSTYATWWIRQAIGRGLSHTARTIRLPVHVEEELSRLRRAERQLGRDLGRDPTREELAEAVGAEPEHVDELLSWRRDPASLDATVDDAGETAMGDLLEDPDGVTPEAEILALDPAGPVRHGQRPAAVVRADRRPVRAEPQPGAADHRPVAAAAAPDGGGGGTERAARARARRGRPVRRPHRLAGGRSDPEDAGRPGRGAQGHRGGRARGRVSQQGGMTPRDAPRGPARAARRRTVGADARGRPPVVTWGTFRKFSGFLHCAPHVRAAPVP